MNYCSLPGVVCPPPEPWQLFMCVLISWAALMSIAGIAVENYRYRIHEMPRWLTILSALMLLSHHPIGLVIQLIAYIQFYVYAPIGASIAVTIYGLFGFYVFWHFTMGPELWKTERRF